MAEAARDLGHEWIALTDHSPRLTVANGLSAERLRAQLELVGELNAELAPFRILTGIEVDILEDGTPRPARGPAGQARRRGRQRALQAADARPRPMTTRMVAAVRNPHVDVLGHCTGRMIAGRGRPESEFDPEAVFTACREHGVAVEINCRPERQDPPDELLRLARRDRAACSPSTPTRTRPASSTGSTAAAPGPSGIGIAPDRVINTRSAAEMRGPRL